MTSLQSFLPGKDTHDLLSHTKFRVLPLSLIHYIQYIHSIMSSCIRTAFHVGFVTIPRFLWDGLRLVLFVIVLSPGFVRFAWYYWVTSNRQVVRYGTKSCRQYLDVYYPDPMIHSEEEEEEEEIEEEEIEKEIQKTPEKKKPVEKPVEKKPEEPEPQKETKKKRAKKDSTTPSGGGGVEVCVGRFWLNPPLPCILVEEGRPTEGIELNTAQKFPGAAGKCKICKECGKKRKNFKQSERTRKKKEQKQNEQQTN